MWFVNPFVEQKETVLSHEETLNFLNYRRKKTGKFF